MQWTDMDRFSLLDTWRSFDRLNRALTGSLAPSTREFPPVNIWASGDRHIITSELPGIDPKDVEISVAGKTVTVHGSRKISESCAGDCEHRHERWTGAFSRSIELPFVIDQEKVEARFSKGVLHLTLPRAASDKPRKITIKAE